MKQTTKPWIPLDVGWWQNIAIELPKPWPRDAVMMDLRWWADQEQMGRAKRPGRRGLMSRWGCTERQARSALKSEEEWGNPTTTAPPVPQQNPTRAPDSERKPLESQEPPPHLCPSKTPLVSPRAKIQNNRTTEQQTRIESSSEDLSVLWKDINAIRKRAGATRMLKLTPARRRALGSRLREFSRPDVLRVVEWWLFSQHTRALFLREGGYTVDTLLRPKFSEYLEFSHQENQAPSTKPSLREMMQQSNENRDPLNVIPFTQTQE